MSDRKDPAASEPAAEEGGSGYCKAPRQHRFKPGQSGNPRGRPRKQVTARDEFFKVNQLPVTINENGKVRKIPTARAVLLATRRAALKGEPWAVRLWTEWDIRYAPETAAQTFFDLEAEDKRLIAAYLGAAASSSPHAEAGDDEAR